MIDFESSTTPTPLPPGGLRPVLRDLGAADEFGNPAPTRTGRLYLVDTIHGRNGSVYLKAGKIYAVSFSGFVPPVLRRLNSGGHLTEEQYQYLEGDEANAGPEAVRLGYIQEDVLEDIHLSLFTASLVHLLEWDEEGVTWEWQPDVTTTEYTIQGFSPNLSIAAAEERAWQWAALLRNYPQVTRHNAVPQPGPDWGDACGQSTTPEMVSILNHVDNQTTVAKIAAECGFTRFEIAARLAKAVADGILIVASPEGPVRRRPAAVEAAEPVQPADDPVENPSDVQSEFMAVQARVAFLRDELSGAEARLNYLRSLLPDEA